MTILEIHQDNNLRRKIEKQKNQNCGRIDPQSFHSHLVPRSGMRVYPTRKFGK